MRAGVRLSIQSVVSSFVCATLIDALMRALEVYSAHEGYIWLGVIVSHHHLCNRGQDQQGLKQHRRWNDGVVTIYAAEG